MDLVRYLARLFSYDAWANGEVLSSLHGAGKTPPRSLKLLGHILAAERIWLERLRHEKQTLPVWPDLSFQECEREAEKLSSLWSSYLSGCKEADLSLTIDYKNSKGELWSSRKQDVLLHVVMHSAYHRGQIAADMRAAGFVPAYTDFIHSVRQGFLE
jgi:uncharacterized damage-inducible protein DinB